MSRVIPIPETDGSEVNAAGVLHQYVCCVFNIRRSPTTTGSSKSWKGMKESWRVKYPERTLNTVKWLSMAQILCGLLMFFAQIAPIVWSVQLWNLTPTWPEMTINVMDHVATGTWTGLMIFVTGIIGLAAGRKNSRCSIVSHMVFNCMSLILAINMVVWALLSLTTVVDCKVNGSEIYTQSSYDYDRETARPYYGYFQSPVTTTTTTTASPATPEIVDLYGEEFTILPGNMDRFTSDQLFYCKNVIFCLWIVLEGVMIVSALVAFAVTICLMVKNSKAMCSCCRKCCSGGDVKCDEDDVSIIGGAY